MCVLPLPPLSLYDSDSACADVIPHVHQWDTYRTLYPLMSLHDPVNFARIVRGMIDIQKNEGVCV